MSETDTTRPDPGEQRERFADRLREAGVSTRRFIDVHDGGKGTRNHTQRGPNAGKLKGNYGVYGGLGGDSDVADDPAVDDFDIADPHIDVRWLVDVDVDDYENDGSETTDGLESLPETFTIESPHTDGDTGGHRYYAVKGHVAKAFYDRLNETKNPSPPWGEVRVSNQYCVGPGSQIQTGGCVHDWCDPANGGCAGCDKQWCNECAKADGGYYRIAKDLPISVLELDEFVDAILTDLETDPTPTDPPATDADADTTETAGEVPDYEPNPNAEIENVLARKPWIGTYLALGPKAAIGEDDRSNADWRVCKDLIKASVSEDDTRELLEESDHTKASERGDYYWNKTWPRAIKSVIEECGEDDEPVPWAGGYSESDDSDDDAGGWFQVKQFFDSSTNGSTTRGYAEATKLLERDHDFATIRETGEMYYYDPSEGHYVRKGRTFIEELLQEHIPGYTNSSRVKNIYETVRARSYIGADEFRPPAGKVNIANGVLDLDTRDVEPHTPDYFFTSRRKAAYHEDDNGEPVADAERWDRFLDESVSPEDKKKIEEFIGYSLETWHHNREKNLFIVGPRQSGKSTCLDTIQALHGEMPHVANLTPQQLADTQFDVAALIEASLNCVNDINASKIEDTGTLKRTFSGERQKLERKFQDAQFGALTAKHLFSANWLPRVVGEDESLYRRVLIVEFPNKVDDDERDLDLKDELKDELDGILVRALDARDRLHEQGGFTADRSDTETRRKWDSWRDAHKRFLYQQFEITGDSDDSVPKDTYYRAYKEFAGREGYELKPKQAVTKALQWVPEIEVDDTSYGGLAWREEDAADPQTDASLTCEVTQDELITKLKRWIREFESPVKGADIQAVYDYGESKGYDRDELSEKFEKLKDGGEVYNPQSGGWRLSD